MPIKLSTKSSLHQNANLKVLLPLLQSNIQELNAKISQIRDDNPFVEVYDQNSKTQNFISNQYDDIEQLKDEESFYDTVLEQFDSTLFPTPLSLNIAKDILNDINEEGYFDGSFEEISLKNVTSIENVEKIHQRFMYLEPKGIGSRNLQECLLFQLYDLNVNKDIYDTLYEIITNPKELSKALKKKGLDKISTTFKNFVYPPCSTYKKKEVDIIPDFIVKFEDNDLSLVYNDTYTPDVKVNNFFRANNDELKKKLKEARVFVDLLNLRKKTLHKIVLAILNIQKEYFANEKLKPLLIKDLAKDFDFNESTISRAVANKYIECDKGIISLKSLFSYKVSNECSLDTVKNEVKKIIENEDKKKPLSDECLKVLVNKSLSLNLSRRVITKYRLSLNIVSSRDRKKLYLLI